MKVHAISSSFVLGILMVASCAVGTEDASVADDLGDLGEAGAFGSVEQSIVKGKPGAVNGTTDYCNNRASLCGLGEGDCDATRQCTAGLACVQDNGRKFGFPNNWDVCAGAHCSNGVLDGDETSADCGGSCGACTSCVGTAGGMGFCVGCLCASGAGDCDTEAQCAVGLTCAYNNGPKFFLPPTYDVCVPPHCTNGVQDAASGETGVDLGGPCEARCGDGVLHSGEVCDDGVNDGVLCSSDCSAEPEVAQIHLHCDGGSAVINALRGTACIVVAPGGASYLTFSSSNVEVVLYSNADCTGNTKTVSSAMNFCQNSFDQGGGLNDQVQSVMVRRR